MPPIKQIKLIDHDQLLTGRILPQAVPIEEAVLGACMVDSSAFNIICDLLNVEDFYLKSHQLIFEAMQQLHKSGSPIDLLTVNEQLNRNKKLEEVGGVMVLIDLGNKVSGAAHIEEHTKIIKLKAIGRNIIKVCADTLRKAFDDEIYPPEIVTDAISELDKTNKLVVAPATMSDLLKEVIDLEFSSGLKSGYKKLDSITQGLVGHLIIAAGPSEGKSLFAVNIAKHVASNGIPVLFFSLEMKRWQIMHRLLSDEFDVSTRDLRSGNYDKARIMQSRIPEYNLTIYDKVFDIDNICSISKGMLKGKKEGLVIIDYLQIAQLNGQKASNRNREAIVSEISRRLKVLEMELGLPVIALSQVSRDKARKTYTLSDLRESGAIEQNADGVIFIYRPVYHGQTMYEIEGVDKPMDEKDAIIIIAKWRDGEVGLFPMTFNGRCSRFEDKQDFSQYEQVNDFDPQIKGMRGQVDEIPF